MEYYSCEWLQDFFIMFNGNLDQHNFMSFCCEAKPDCPGISIKERTATESLDAFLEYRNRIIEASKKFAEENSGSDVKPPINGCKDCVQFKKANWETKESACRVNFSIYPSPCQCKCIYCDVNKEKFELTEEIKEKYEKVFSIVDEASKRGLITGDTRNTVACGEITIHPYKNRIYEYLKDKSANFSTNCFLYDEKIAESLNRSAKSTIFLSIDAGLSDTWQKVKGFNNFEKVIDNLVQYHNAAQDPNQITLKYIVLPGVNTTEEDYLNLINIMKSFKIIRLDISRDFRTCYKKNIDNTELIYSTAYLVLMCLENDIECNLASTFSEEENNLIIETVKLIVEELENNG